MKNIKELKGQYFEARNAMDWQKLANIMGLVYLEPDFTPQPLRSPKIKPLQAGCRLNE